MNEGVRDATLGDIPVLVELYEFGAAEMTELKPAWARLDARVPPLAGSFTADLADPDTALAVGTLDEVPVGYLAARVAAPATLVAGDHLVISDVFVLAGARELSVGELLVARALEWGRGRGVRSAEIRVLPGHRAAKNFCEENGFTARLLVMHHDLT